MGNLLYVWLGGVAVLFARQVYLLTRLLQNLAPGIQRRDIWPGPHAPRGGRFTASTKPELFNEIGQKYRRFLIWNERIFVIWFFVAGPIFAILGRL
jgi:hypothetical protein